MRILAIDYGDAHTGIAISDPTGLLAGFTTVIDAYRPEVVAERVAALAREHGGWCWDTPSTWTAPGAPAPRRPRP